MDCSPTKYFLEIDTQKQSFRLSTPVFRGSSSLPQMAARFFMANASRRTSIAIEKGTIVMLREEIPCSWGPQPSLREKFYGFLRRAQRCRHLFKRIKHLEQLRDVDSILES
jgi:hypothetical protein